MDRLPWRHPFAPETRSRPSPNPSQLTDGQWHFVSSNVKWSGSIGLEGNRSSFRCVLMRCLLALLLHHQLNVKIERGNFLVTRRRRATEVRRTVVSFVAKRLAGEGIIRQRHWHFRQIRGQRVVVCRDKLAQRIDVTQDCDLLIKPSLRPAEVLRGRHQGIGESLTTPARQVCTDRSDRKYPISRLCRRNNRANSSTGKLASRCIRRTAAT
jgi:hypothetical protein